VYRLYYGIVLEIRRGNDVRYQGTWSDRVQDSTLG
jgi:hypothetical protein